MVGLFVDPDEPLIRLRTSERQLVEIAKALGVNARVLIMDEPTAALSQREGRPAFQRCEPIAETASGDAVFVSHRMDEIYQIADRVAVLRDGRFKGLSQNKCINISSELIHWN